MRPRTEDPDASAPLRADALEAALIDSSPVQRLRSVRQLGFTWLVFPGAEQSRFSHFLGAMELAGRRRYQTVLTLYPAARLESRPSGLLLKPGRPHVSKTTAA